MEGLEAVAPIEVTICKHMMLLLQAHDIVDVAAVLIVAVGLFAVVTAAFAVATVATTYYCCFYCFRRCCCHYPFAAGLVCKARNTVSGCFRCIPAIYEVQRCKPGTQHE